MLLTVNTLIQWNDYDKKVERILWIDNKNEYAFVIKINSNKWPDFRLLSDITEAIEDGSCSILEKDPWAGVIDECNLSEKNKSIRDKAWEVISLITNNLYEPEIYYAEKRGEIIMNISKAFGISERSIYRYLKRYWQRGKSKNALLPDYNKCGKAKERTLGESKLGRPRKFGKIIGDGINVDEEVKKIFRIAIDKFYYSSKKNSLTMVYELMLKKYFSENFKIENGIRIPLMKQINQIPTFGQFRYYFEKERNYKKEIVSRKSAKKYELENRVILGNSTYEAIGPGSIFQVDATVADVYLISRYNKNWIIGRPIVYFMMDVFSKCVTSVYVGLEGPSWTGMAMTLAIAGSDKVKFCKEYGIEINEEQWPMHHLPETIIGDRGELEGKNIESLINSLNIKIQNTSSYRGDMKGLIERYFKTTHEKIKPFTPGFVDIDFKARGKSYRLDAKLDIYQFTQIIIRSVIYHNNYNLLNNYNRDEMMIEDDVRSIPLELWNWGIKNRAGKLRSFEEDILKLNLMPEDTATVTAKGIKFKNIFYGSELALKEKWFERARNKGSWKIIIAYDPRLMDFIYLKSDDGKGFEKLFLLDHQERYQNKTLEEIEYLFLREELDQKLYSDNKLQTKIDMISEIEAIVDKATKEAKNQRFTDISKKKRIEGIRQNRQVEKLLNRQNEAFELNKHVASDDSEIISIDRYKDNESELEEDVEILRKKQRDRLNERFK